MRPIKRGDRVEPSLDGRGYILGADGLSLHDFPTENTGLTLFPNLKLDAMKKSKIVKPSKGAGAKDMS
jgi:hypothetical protein